MGRASEEMIMRYYKQITGNYILAIGTGYGGEKITETEYNSIMSIIQSHPQAAGKGYRLKTDLTWEEYDLPVIEVSDDDEISNDEALEILLGGAT